MMKTGKTVAMLISHMVRIPSKSSSGFKNISHQNTSYKFPASVPPCLRVFSLPFLSSFPPLHYFSTLILVLVLCSGLGCRKQQPKAEFPEQLGIEDYGRLPGLKRTSLEKLQNELARVVEQQGTPELLDGVRLVSERTFADRQPSSKCSLTPDALNVAAGLADAFPKKTLQSLQDAADKHFPRGRFEFNALQLRAATGFLLRHQKEFLKARRALQRPKCDFGIKHIRGFGNDVSFMDRTRLAGRLEAFAAAESLFLDDNIEAAIRAMQNMLQWAQHLGNEKHASARLQAGMLRAEAFGVLQAVVLHPRCQKKDLDRLHEIIHKHLAEWPRDADAWIGDRALGMHCYEIVRDGGIAGLLTPEEVKEFTSTGSLLELSAAAKAIADEDELFYLCAMRKVIESCKLPYYQRANVAEEILDEAAAKSDSPDYPLVADRLLLPNINHGLRMQAADRALAESWAVGLETAIGRPASYTVNPLTGKKYRISPGKQQVSVLEHDDGGDKAKATVVVPRGSAGASPSR